MPMFSIILVHDQKTTSHNVYLRGLKSLGNQTFRDFEVLQYHDGPLLDDTVVFPDPIVCSDKRYDDWGHSLRNIGIRDAKGDYLLHFDSSGILYPNALEDIVREINRPFRFTDDNGFPDDPPDIIIFSVKRWGMIKFRKITCQVLGNPDFYLIIDGNTFCLDNMQTVMRRELWLAEGGWRDKRQYGHGYMIEEFAKKYGYRQIADVLGESMRGEGPGTAR